VEIRQMQDASPIVPSSETNRSAALDGRETELLLAFVHERDIHCPRCDSITTRDGEENLEDRRLFVNVLMCIDMRRSQAEIHESLGLRLPFPPNFVRLQRPQLAPGTRKVPVLCDQ